jgi:hypothetical protein
MLKRHRFLFVDERGVRQGFFKQAKILESMAQQGLEWVGGGGRSHNGEYTPRTGLLDAGLFEEQTGIDPAEPKRIRQGNRHCNRPGPVRNVVQIARRIRMIQIDCRG